MQKKLTKHGNSLALIIERPILDLLKIESDTLLEVSTDGENLVISPVRGLENSQDRENKVQELLKRTNKKYSKALSNLAK